MCGPFVAVMALLPNVLRIPSQRDTPVSVRDTLVGPTVAAVVRDMEERSSCRLTVETAPLVRVRLSSRTARLRGELHAVCRARPLVNNRTNRGIFHTGNYIMLPNAYT